MKQQSLKLYPVVSPTADKERKDWGSTYDFSDLFISEEEKKSYPKVVERYRGLYSMSKQTTLVLVQRIYEAIGISTDRDFLRSVRSISPQVRKTIKDKDHELLEILDSPEFLPTYLYLLAGFAVSSRASVSHKGINTIQHLSGAIYSLLNNPTPQVSSFFCAHRQDKTVAANEVTSSINEPWFQNVRGLLHGILDNCPQSGDFSIDYYNMYGDKEGINSVFPNIFLNYFEQGRLHELGLGLNSQFESLSQNIGTREQVSPTQKHTRIVYDFLSKRYGEGWGEIELSRLQELSSEDNLASIALHHAFPDLSRVENEFQKFIEQHTKDSIGLLIRKNIENSPLEKREIVEGAMEMFFSRSTAYAKALYEVAFYYIWGKKCKEEGSIGLGLDRDHHVYQTKGFTLGFGSGDAPILYARRTGKNSMPKIGQLSFRQFWYNDFDK